ncbi:hypothetical protein BKA93DRAFT_827127 [Sparassis latifolia]
MAEMNSTENAKKQKTAMLVAQVSDHQMRIEVLEGEKELLRMEMESFKTVAETYEKLGIRAAGAELVPGAAKPIRDLLISDAEESVKKKFRALQKALRDEKLIGARGRSVTVQRDMNAMAYEDNDSAEAGGNGAVKDMPVTAKKSTHTVCSSE